MANEEEEQYLDLLRKIMVFGSPKDDRTGNRTLSLFGQQMRFSLENNVVPVITTKKLFIRGVIEELLFFIRGETNTKKLEAKGVNIWKGNTSREFLDKRGLKYLPEGEMGKGYGYQWRKFGQHENDYGDFWCGQGGVDQLSNALHLIKTDPNSRKIIVSAWNPQQLKEMALEPCHVLSQYYVDNGKLSCQYYQRSVDSFLGAPFNILSYAILTKLMAKAAGLQPGELVFSGGDCHVYKNHLKQATEQVTREPFPFPKLFIDKDISSIEDMEKLEFSDFRIEGYECHSAIKADMAV